MASSKPIAVRINPALMYLKQASSGFKVVSAWA